MSSDTMKCVSRIPSFGAGNSATWSLPCSFGHAIVTARGSAERAFPSGPPPPRSCGVFERRRPLRRSLLRTVGRFRPRVRAGLLFFAACVGDA